MTFITSLSVDDLTRYSSLVREGIRIRRHLDLLRWLQGEVQHFLPHEIMIAAWGDFGLGLIHYDIVSKLPGVRTQFSDPEMLRRLLCGLFKRWVELGREPYSLRVGTPGFSLDDSRLQCALGSALENMRSAMVHGIYDERGRHDCLYVAFSLRDKPDGLTSTALAYLLPYLDTALRQVTHTLDQHPTDQVEDAATELGEEFSLSERESEVMSWVRMGKTNAEIGIILNISAFTVKNHLQNIFKKMGVYNRTQAVSRLEQGGAVDA